MGQAAPPTPIITIAGNSSTSTDNYIPRLSEPVSGRVKPQF
jgi:hypothetical protein